MKDSTLAVDIVIPVHNRKAITLRCLERLRESGVLAWATPLIVDDGSTDGTSEAVREQYPEAVLVVGDGNLWWTGAVALGMQRSLDRGSSLIFWLNDDCLPEPGTMELLARRSRENGVISTAQAFTPSGGCYRAYERTRSGLRELFAKPGEILACDTFNGNCVCIPRAWVEKTGLPDAASFPHMHGDIDYGLRLSRSGARIEVLGDAVCRNDDNSSLASTSWLQSPEPMGRIFKTFSSQKSSLYPPAFFRYKFNHWGLAGLPSFLSPYLRFFVFWALRLILPRRWLLALAAPAAN